jgi:phospholipid/cholesterol/gamma-HCH transport system permease protein
MDFVIRFLGALGRKGAVWAEEFGQMGLLVQKTAKAVPRMHTEPVAVQMIRFGIRAIPIVSLVNLFVGMIVAVSMSEMLISFNAINRTAQIVSVAVTRELGPLMTGLVMSGFAGAAIAAEIGTMAVNEEILALEAAALSPIRFLVLPRVLGVMAMMMCLTLIADVVGMFGGYLVGVYMLDIPPLTYLRINNDSVKLADIPKGLIKAAAFGLIITVVACRQGLKADGGALGVGRATTTAVVYSIVIIIAANLAFAILFNWTLAGP